MINRLREIKISGDMLRWFDSYPSVRTYLAKINKEYSNLLTSMHRVPQWSVLGLFLFNGYFLPMGRIIEKLNIVLYVYADDTKLYLDLDSRHKNITTKVRL